MVRLDDILDAINAHKNRVLLVAEASLPASQFGAFRKIVLDEFGNSGLVKDLQRLFTDRKDRQG